MKLIRHNEDVWIIYKLFFFFLYLTYLPIHLFYDFLPIRPYFHWLFFSFFPGIGLWIIDGTNKHSLNAEWPNQSWVTFGNTIIWLGPLTSLSMTSVLAKYFGRSLLGWGQQQQKINKWDYILIFFILIIDFAVKSLSFSSIF